MDNFNSRPHEEVDRMLHPSLRNIRHFNSRPHKKVDRNRKSGSSVGIIFQLTTSRRGRREKNTAMTEWNPFQLTTSRGDRLEPTSLPLAMCDHFNSRPHEEIDKDLRVALWHLVISTHEEIDSPELDGSVWTTHFNSRPRKEVDNVLHL